MTSLATRNRNVAIRAALFGLAMLALAFAAVPLYRVFCQVTGFGGTTMRAEAAPGAVAGQVGDPGIRLFFIAEALAELQVFVGIQRERQQPYHQPVVGFGRVLRERQRMILIIVPVHVGDLQVGFVDG